MYLYNKISPRVILEVVADNIPEEKTAIHMTNEFNLEFYPLDDDDIDTSVFTKPYRKFIFDGHSKMVDDTIYNNAFERRILKMIPFVKVVIRKALNLQVPLPEEQF